MADAVKPIRRIAQVWTPLDVVSVAIVGDWPRLLRVREWVYRPDLARDLTPIVTRGRHSGGEFVTYRTRFKASELRGDEAARVVSTERVSANAYRECATPDRPTEGDDADVERGDGAPRRRRHFNGGERSDAV